MTEQAATPTNPYLVVVAASPALDPYQPDFSAELLDAVITRMVALTREHAQIAAEMEALAAAGIVDATASYEARNGSDAKYMRLLIHNGRGEPRQKEYIGADPARQREALARIERHKRHGELAAKRSETNRQIAEIRRAWQSLAYSCGLQRQRRLW